MDSNSIRSSEAETNKFARRSKSKYRDQNETDAGRWRGRRQQEEDVELNCQDKARLEPKRGGGFWSKLGCLG